MMYIVLSGRWNGWSKQAIALKLGKKPLHIDTAGPARTIIILYSEKEWLESEEIRWWLENQFQGKKSISKKLIPT